MKLNRLLMSMAVLPFVLYSCSSDKGRITPVPFNEVVLEDGFWKTRMKTELEVTVPFSIEQCRPAVERFRICADYRAGKRDVLPEPHRFISSDLYKVMEGVAYSLMQEPDDSLEMFMDSTIDLIAESQMPDGYLYISHICGNPNVEEMGDKPYSWVVHSHELYNVGHLYEAAVAYYQATGKRKLLDVAIKNADHVNRVFFEGDPAYNDGKPVNQAPGHEEIELALCKLYRVTGNRKYLDMAKRFLEIRGVTYIPDGEGVMSPEYAQQHLPVALQRKPAGHAVRAGYLYAAMAQVDALTGENAYKEALDSIWTDLVSTRMHITGGLGATEGIEGFGEPYDLPNKTAYNETCAAVANVFFNYGMFLAEGDGKYMDIAELSLFNNALAGISLAGDRFFYVNPLEADGKRKFNHGLAERAEWFGCACCPPNISRLILQVPGYMYAYRGNDIYLTLYGSSKVTVPLKKTAVRLEQVSGYPFDGNVKVVVTPERECQFSLKFRVPTWSGGTDFVPGGLYRYIGSSGSRISVYVNGKAYSPEIKDGFAKISRRWSPGDVLEFALPVEGRFVKSDDRVEEDRNSYAVVRGPVVFCAEEIDNGCRIQDLSVSRLSVEESTFNCGVLGGLPELSVPGYRRESGGIAECNIKMIPYYAWCNRGGDKTMMVWLNDSPEHCSELEASSLMSLIMDVKSSSGSGGLLEKSLVDVGTDIHGDGTSVGWMSDKSGKEQYIDLFFRHPVMMSSLGVYWSVSDGAALPDSWKVMFLSDGQWQDMKLYVTDSYQVRQGQFNVVHPAEPFESDRIRICVTPGSSASAAISKIYLE